MPTCKHRLPGFRTSCLIVCVVYTVLAGGILLRGVGPSMAEFAVPAPILESPHYQDAIHWVYTHMLVLGLIVGLVGYLAEGGRLKLWFTRLLLLAHIYYTWLDARASDSFLGTGLYRGPGSLAPVIVCALVTLLFAHLSLCPATAAPTPARNL